MRSLLVNESPKAMEIHVGINQSFGYGIAITHKQREACHTSRQFCPQE